MRERVRGYNNPPVVLLSPKSEAHFGAVVALDANRWRLLSFRVKKQKIEYQLVEASEFRFLLDLF